jgi:8-oxo-dGTP pyrophosphatase MutT (NUDIX family)
MNKDLHGVQVEILKELSFNNGSRFSELNTTSLTNDHFTFHLNRLLDVGLIEKLGSKYYLTLDGKKYITKVDVQDKVITSQATVSVIVAPVRANGEEFLIQQRTKEPMFGLWGFMSGKVRKFETSLEAAKRELDEETGLRGGSWSFIGVAHRLRGPNKSDLLVDNFFFIWRVDDPKGNLVDTKEGKNYWLSEKEVLAKREVFTGFKDTFDHVKLAKEQQFYEKYYKMDSM